MRETDFPERSNRPEEVRRIRLKILYNFFAVSGKGKGRRDRGRGGQEMIESFRRARGVRKEINKIIINRRWKK